MPDFDSGRASAKMRNMAEPDMSELLKEIRDLQREALDRQNRFLWVLVPIFAILCIQTVLAIMR